jgi:hypothetical protein
MVDVVVSITNCVGKCRPIADALRHAKVHDTVHSRSELGLGVHVPLGFRIFRAHQSERIARRLIKLPLKRLGHAIEDWVANQSPMGNSSVIDTKAFEWVERLEKNSDVIRQELVALLYEQKHLPNIQEISPRQTNLTREDGWKSYFFFVLGHRIDESYRRCPGRVN